MARSDNKVGITRTDLAEMRRIFDERVIPRPRHAFRWSNTLGRWEIYEVAPADRTLIAHTDDSGTWIED